MKSIEINELTFTYPGANAPTLKNISLEIEKGDFLAIIGNNGCGKSTFCKVINGLIPHFISGEFTGSVKIEGNDTMNLDVGTLAKKVGYVYQDFENQIVRPTAIEDASFACLNYGMENYEAKGRKAIADCGLEGHEEDYIWQLSGGQTHLLALAGAVALGPDILILDEPIAQLDPKHADQIYEVLRSLNELHGKTIIVIEHHTEYIAEYCKNVLLLRDGEVSFFLPTKEALVRVEELQECNVFPPQITLAAERLGMKNDLPIRLSDGKNRFANLSYEEVEKEHRVENPGKVIARFQEVGVSYRSVKGEPKTIFENLNLQILHGEKIALIGSNGAGKSTLMKLMIGLIKPAKGSIEVKDCDIKRKTTEELSHQLSLVYQNPEDMFIKDSIYGDISYAMQVRGVKNWEEETKRLLEKFRLQELAQMDGRLLSGGQMRRASLAIGIALNPEILLLDEPTANLDIATRKEIMKTLNEMKDITETVMIATHDMQLVCEWANRIIVLCDGEVVADGTRNQIFSDQLLANRVGIRPPEIFAMGQALDTRAFCYTVEEFVENFKEEINGKSNE